MIIIGYISMFLFLCVGVLSYGTLWRRATWHPKHLCSLCLALMPFMYVCHARCILWDYFSSWPFPWWRCGYPCPGKKENVVSCTYTYANLCKHVHPLWEMQKTSKASKWPDSMSMVHKKKRISREGIPDSDLCNITHTHSHTYTLSTFCANGSWSSTLAMFSEHIKRRCWRVL